MEIRSEEIVLLLVAVLPALVTGLLTYFTTKKRIQENQSEGLFTKALELSDAYQDAYREATDDLYTLKAEIDALRAEVQSLVKYGEMWRGVATQAFIEHGGDPEWWPQQEPRPTT